VSRVADAPRARGPRPDPDENREQARERLSRADRSGRRRGRLRGALLLVTSVGLLFAFVYPTRTFLEQRDEMHRAGQQLSVLDRENAKLEAEAKRLQNDAEIERIARERYGLVKPGERPFVIIPAPTTTTTTTLPGNP
jgi:cell division protein FtsB